MKSKSIALIPARLQSQRFPEKVLHPIRGEAMINHVYKRVHASGLVSEVIVVTDHPKIYRHCLKNKMTAMLSSACHQSGTDRCAEIARKLDAEYILNIQGDEPLVRDEHIALLLQGLQSGAEISTIALEADDHRDYQDPDVVKVVRDKHQQALYFSRASVPYYRERESHLFLQHMGFYGFRREVLIEVSEMPSSHLEKSEKLEQLRWLENGKKIWVGVSRQKTIGVDRIEDVAKVEEALMNARE